jgi:hypothetical protein
MSKKSRSARTKNRATETNRNQDYKKSSINPAISTRKTEKQAGMAAAAVLPISHDYVKSDLVQIGIISAVLILIIIILAFIPGLTT